MVGDHHHHHYHCCCNQHCTVAGNLNPAVSVGLLVGGELPLVNALLYILVQVSRDDGDDADDDDGEEFDIDELDGWRSMSAREQFLCIQAELISCCTLTALESNTFVAILMSISASLGNSSSYHQHLSPSSVFLGVLGPSLY